MLAGAIVVLHPFKKNMGFNPHLHVLVTEGGFDKREWKKMCDWHRWYQSQNAIARENEFIVWDNDVAGTADALLEIDGQRVLVDWKTGNSIHDENHIQVSAYFDMANRMGKKVDKAVIVHVGAKNKDGIKVYDVDTKKGLLIFKNVLMLYKELFPNKKAPSSIYPLSIKLK